MYRSEAMPFPVYHGLGRAGLTPELSYWQMMGGMSAMEVSASPSSRSTSSQEEKALAASKSHSEAERRRRERINNHLSHLRTLLPNTAKADKASLLKAVVDRVRDLKRQAAEVISSNGEDGAGAAGGMPMLPGEADEVTLEAERGGTTIRAIICCEDRPELLADLNAALKSLRVRAVRAEIATIGGRTKGALHIRGTEVECAAIRRAMKAVVDKGGRIAPVTASGETAAGGGKRPRFGGSNPL